MDHSDQANNRQLFRRTDYRSRVGRIGFGSCRRHNDAGLIPVAGQQQVTTHSHSIDPVQAMRQHSKLATALAAPGRMMSSMLATAPSETL